MKNLQVLVLEDNHDDVLLLERELKRCGYHPTLRVEETPEGTRAALDDPSLQLVLSDYHMPRLTAPEAVDIVRDSGRDLPFIVVSGSIGETAAVDVLTRGAADFVSKENLSRLAPAIERELREVAVRSERREAEQRLREALQARDEFLSIASHELRTPLTTMQLQLGAISSYVGINALGDERFRRRIDLACRSADRLSALIDRVLDVSLLASERAVLYRQPGVNLGEVVQRVVDELQPAWENAGCAIELEQTDVTGHWDVDQLVVVVTNLVTNAIKYGAHKPIHIRVENAGAAARLTVRDEGIGIAAEDQLRIFDRFERAVSHSHYGGFGVGLWQSRVLVELHGGRIEVRSQPGAGATFVVELPREAP